MASGLSQEEENYIRMCLLMTGISTRAARIVFDHEIAPSCLKSTLNKKYNILQKLRNEGKINQIQWNLLFRNKPDVPDSKTFDVTLMITLLRHLTDLTPPGGYDRLPSANEIKPLSDLARIKYYRNILAHLVEEKIEDTEFLTAWDIVTGAISRLGGLTMKQECDNLMVKILDQSNQEIIELKESMESLKKVNEDTTIEVKKLKTSHEDTTIDLKKLKTCLEDTTIDVKKLKTSHEDTTTEVNKLKASHEDTTTEVKKLIASHEDTVPWNIRAQINEILAEWKDNEKMFITTRAAKHVLKCIKENSCVTITASSGVGKTATLRYVALQMKLEGYDVLLVTDPGDIVKFSNPTQKTLFVIDDLCGNFSLNEIDIKVWEPVMERIKKILSNKLFKIIVACRLQVYQDEKFESLSIFMSCVCNLLSESMCLSTAEKVSIAELYLQTKAHTIRKYYDFYECFPLLCKLYHENPSHNITDFFLNPFTVYESEIDKLQKKGFYRKYCALALCVMFDNNLNEDMLTGDVNDETRAVIENTFEACRLDRGTSRLTLQDDLNSFINTFLKREQNIYKTIHDKMFDFLAYYFGQKMICCLIKNAQSGLISKRFLLERQNSKDQFITIVPPEYHQMYTQRMIDDWSKGKVNDVFCNINMKIPQFRKKFHFRLNELDISYQRKLAHIYDVENNDTALLMSCFEGDIPMIDWCFSHDVDVNQCRNNGRTPLLEATCTDQTKIVRMLLDKGADLNKCDNSGVLPIMSACIFGHIEIVRMLLDTGADYNKCDSDGWSPLVKACRYGHTEIVKMLLDTGADYNKCNNYGWSPIMSACIFGHIEIVRMLLDTGADYHKCDINGWSPLMKACRIRRIEIVRMLLDTGADYNKCDSDGWSPLTSACRYGHTEIVKMLLDIGADYDKYDNNGWSPLKSAYRYGYSKIVRMLLDTGADYNICVGRDRSLLIEACVNGHTEIVRMLLDKGANYNERNKDGMSSLISACRHGHTEIVRMLLDIGANCNACDNIGRSPLKVASGHGHTEIVRLLLDKVEYYNESDSNNWSSLQVASRYGYTEIVRMLLDKGANYDICDLHDCSPVKAASSAGHTEIVRLLLEKGADYEKCDKNGWSPLKIACCAGHTKIVKLLLDKGADYDKCDTKGWSPVKSACCAGHTQIVKLLLDKGADYYKCDGNRLSPVKSAYDAGHTEIVRMLLGAHYKKCDNDGWSLVEMERDSEYKGIERVLLDKGL